MNKNLALNISILSTYFILLAVLIFFINEKTNLHMDEVSSYCCANNSYDTSISIHVDYANKYDDPEAVWTRHMVVDNNHRFDYANTYKIMATDNHPPFYFYLLHTVSSFFPGQYSKWFAGIINILCALGILYISQKTVYLLTEDKKSVLVSSLLVCFSGGLISAATYLRNYYIAILFVSAFLYVILKGLRKTGPIFYISIIVLFVLGVMTHYYIAIFYFFVSALYVIDRLIVKKYRDVIKYVGSAALSAVLYAILDFESIRTVFSGRDRSGEVMDNLTLPFSMLLGKIVRCFGIVNTQIFSKLGLIIITLILALIIFIIAFKKEKIDKNRIHDYVISFGGIIGYIIFVAIITVYETPRYFYPIYAVLLIIAFCIAQNCIAKSFKGIYAYLALVLLFVLSTALQFKQNIHYLYRSTKPFLERAKEYGDSDCIFITEHSYDVNSSYYEMKNYRSVTFYNYENYNEIENADVDITNGLIVSYNVNCDIESVNEVIFARWPELVNVTDVGIHEGNITKYYSR